MFLKIKVISAKGSAQTNNYPLYGMSFIIHGFMKIIIDFIDVPMPPEGPLEICNVTECSLQLKWYAPRDSGGGPLIGYIIDTREVKNLDVIR